MKKVIFISFVLFSLTALSQNVGIGTNTPSYKLDVAGRMRLQHTTNSTSGIYFDGPTNPTRSFVGTLNNDYIGIWGALSNWNFVMNVNNGNTGIGNTNPTEKLHVTGNIRTSGEIKPNGVGGQANQVLTSTGNGTMVWASPTTAPGNYGTVVNPVTGKVWLDRNLGASQVATSLTDPLSYGDLYQWGRGADGHEKKSSSTTTTKASTYIAGVNNSWDGNFIISPSSVPINWLENTVTESHMWSGTGGENNPCPSGFRVPTMAEWAQERATWTSNNANGAFNSVLKLPLAGIRNKDGDVLNEGALGYYYASTPLSPTVPKGYCIRISGSSVLGTIPAFPVEGLCIRCIND